jgi:ABC-type uncharacterized transport system permease subunit
MLAIIQPKQMRKVLHFFYQYFNTYTRLCPCLCSNGSYMNGHHKQHSVWSNKFDNNVTILQALLDTGRYPASVYPFWLRIIVTFLIPVAVATTIPLQALRGELSALQVLMFVAISAAAFLIATRVWKAGVKKYSGASS